jgi:8-oxo-dGTP pyrophosphatase MutT (NUDIX family)
MALCILLSFSVLCVTIKEMEVKAVQYGNTEVFLTLNQREELIASLMGKTVEVVIYRPIGYVHVTKGVTLHYTVNYGYIPGIQGGDGEEQDVYVLGISEPVARFRGRIIGAIRRRDDNEDKLVAAPEGMLFHQAEIAEATWFVEQYFDSSVDSLLRKSCGVVPYRMSPQGLQLLLVRQSNGCWSFPKGHMDRGESEQETALRELKEETGLEAVLHSGFREVVEYGLRSGGRKQVVLFLGQVQGIPRMDGREVTVLEWVSPEEAKARMRKEQHPVLDRVQEVVYAQTI